MKEKDNLRETMKLKRESLCFNEKISLDNLIYKNIIENSYFVEAQSIFIFVSFGSEVDTHRIIEHALSQGKKVSVPKVISRNQGMKAITINSFKDLVPGKMGILEPNSELTEELLENIDLVILPGLAFDRLGGRLGYGGGFYDRFLCEIHSNTVILGIAYDLQIVGLVPMEEKDIRFHKLITEKNTY